MDREQEFYDLLEARSPGDVIEVDVKRMIPPLPEDGSAPETEDHTFTVELEEWPLPDQPQPLQVLRDLDFQDQLRLGMVLREITKPLAEYFGLSGPEGVVVFMAFLKVRDSGIEQETNHNLLGGRGGQ